MKRQQGFTLIEGVFVVLMFSILTAVGYLAYTNFIAVKNKETPAVSASAETKPVKVEKKADLVTASSELDNVSLDDSEITQLDNAINSF